MKFILLGLILGLAPFTAYSASDYHEWSKYCASNNDKATARSCEKVNQLCEQQGHKSEACTSSRKSVMSPQSLPSGKPPE